MKTGQETLRLNSLLPGDVDILLPDLFSEIQFPQIKVGSSLHLPIGLDLILWTNLKAKVLRKRGQQAHGPVKCSKAS